MSESSVGLLYAELTPEKDLYFSITLPSLIIATCGGGTGLPTQRECLEAMGCYGVGKVYKFAEIVAGTVLAMTLSALSAAGEADKVASATFFTAQIDFTEAGDLRAFLGDETMATLEQLTLSHNPVTPDGVSTMIAGLPALVRLQVGFEDSALETLRKRHEGIDFS